MAPIASSPAATAHPPTAFPPSVSCAHCAALGGDREAADTKAGSHQFQRAAQQHQEAADLCFLRQLSALQLWKRQWHTCVVPPVVFDKQPLADWLAGAVADKQAGRWRQRGARAGNSGCSNT